METVLVIAAHPDDEILGCGAVMAKHINDGDQLTCVILGSGVTSRSASSSNHDLELMQLRESTVKAHKCIGNDNLIFLDYPDNKFDSVPLLDLVQDLEGVTREINPTMIYTHHWSDVNVDHRLTFDAVSAIARSMPGQTIQEIRHFEIVSSTNWSLQSGSSQFHPNLFVDITDFMESKKDALICYKSEMRDFPHTRSLESIDALAAYRGSSVGTYRAEAFEVSRRIIK